VNEWSTGAPQPSQPSAGWYPNPDGSGSYRYWDGAQWTNAVAAQPAPDPSTGATTGKQTHMFAGGNGTAIVTPLGTTNVARIAAIVALVLAVVLGYGTYSSHAADVEARRQAVEWAEN
jgi:hypothetical protein